MNAGRPRGSWGGGGCRRAPRTGYPARPRSPRATRMTGSPRCAHSRASPRWKLHDAALGIELRELLDAIERALGPGREGRRRPSPRASRASRRDAAAACSSLAVERGAAREVACFRSSRKPSASDNGGRPGRGFASVAARGRRPSVRRETPQRRRPRPRRGRERDEQDDAASGAHADDDSRAAATRGLGPGVAIRLRVATVRKVMASYRELLARVKEEIDEISSTEAQELLDSPEPPLFVDVRETDEWEEGHIPGAVYVSARPARAADRGPRPGQEPPARRLLLGRLAVGIRREVARRARLRGCRQPRRAASPTGSGTASR